jgi:hypothetical protein
MNAETGGGLTAARLGELMQDRGEADTIGSERSGWFILGVGGYFDIDNATWQEFDESDAPWDSDNFVLHGDVRDLAARQADRDAALARVEALPEKWTRLIRSGHIEEPAASLLGVACNEVRAALHPAPSEAP